MDTIKLLDSLEVGMPLVITTKYLGVPAMREACLYAGKDKNGRYNFFDDSGITGIFAYSTKFIQDNVIIETEINHVDDMLEIADLCEKIKGRE